MKKPIVVVGSINLDLVATAERIPNVGETVSGKQFNTFFGGKGANQAVAIGRLGCAVRMLGKVGNDAFGKQLRDALESDGVDVEAVEVAQGASGVALISISDHGENSIIVVPGANGTFEKGDVDRHRHLIEQAGIVLTQLEIPMEVVEHLAEITDAAHVPLMLDPAPVQPLSRELLHRLDWITPNESEARMLLGPGANLEGESGTLNAVQKLLGLGVRNVVLKLGKRGALVAQASGLRAWIPAFKVDALDTTAAGDAFNGGFAVGLMSGKTPEESGRFAAAAAAISVTRRGAQPSMPSFEEVEEFLRHHQSAAEA